MISIDEIYTALTDVFREVFEDDEIVPTPTTTASDVHGWGSLEHVRLVLTVEETFGVHFTAAQVSSMSNVSDMAHLIQRKLC